MAHAPPPRHSRAAARCRRRVHAVLHMHAHVRACEETRCCKNVRACARAGRAAAHLLTSRKYVSRQRLATSRFLTCGTATRGFLVACMWHSHCRAAAACGMPPAPRGSTCARSTVLCVHAAPATFNAASAQMTSDSRPALLCPDWLDRLRVMEWYAAFSCAASPPCPATSRLRCSASVAIGPGRGLVSP